MVVCLFAAAAALMWFRLCGLKKHYKRKALKVKPHQGVQDADF
jgi:hypothetical protein